MSHGRLEHVRARDGTTACTERADRKSILAPDDRRGCGRTARRSRTRRAGSPTGDASSRPGSTCPAPPRPATRPRSSGSGPCSRSRARRRAGRRSSTSCPPTTSRRSRPRYAVGARARPDDFRHTAAPAQGAGVRRAAALDLPRAPCTASSPAPRRSSSPATARSRAWPCRALPLVDPHARPSR